MNDTLSPLSRDQHRAVESHVIPPRPPLASRDSTPAPADPRGLSFTGKCQTFSDGSFQWTLDLLDTHGRVLTVTGAVNAHATVVLRQLGRCAEVAPDQFSYLIGRA